MGLIADCAANLDCVLYLCFLPFYLSFCFDFPVSYRIPCKATSNILFYNIHSNDLSLLLVINDNSIDEVTCQSIIYVCVKIYNLTLFVLALF